MITNTSKAKIPQTLCAITPAGMEAFEKYRKQINKFLKK